MTGPVRGCVAWALVVALGGAVPAEAAPAEATSSVTAPAPSSTGLAVEGAVVPPVQAVHGQPLSAVAQVSVPGAVPDGWVFFVVDGLAHRTDLAADGTASTTIEGLRTGTHRVSATFVPRDPATQEGSASAETVVEVQRAVPRAALRVTGRRTDRDLAVRVRVRTPYGTEATGRVAVTLKRRGAGARRSRRVLLVDDVARVSWGRVPAGTYRVLAAYPGDAGTVGFRLVREVRVRRP